MQKLFLFSFRASVSNRDVYMWLRVNENLFCILSGYKASEMRKWSWSLFIVCVKKVRHDVCSGQFHLINKRLHLNELPHQLVHGKTLQILQSYNRLIHRWVFKSHPPLETCLFNADMQLFFLRGCLWFHPKPTVTFPSCLDMSLPCCFPKINRMKATQIALSTSLIPFHRAYCWLWFVLLSCQAVHINRVSTNFFSIRHSSYISACYLDI